jgi:hypothetical protein
VHKYRRRWRCAAIIAIADNSTSSPVFEDHCKTAVFEDRDINVRMTALSALAKIYQNTPRNHRPRPAANRHERIVL